MAELHISTIIKDYATAAALILGGIWALWKWGYGERLRHNREMASLDGTLTTSSVNLDDGKTAVTLHAIWRNRGPLPIQLCPQHTVVKVFQISRLSVPNRLTLKDGSGVPLLLSAKPDWNVYIMEPNTDSIMHEHFILDSRSLYGFKWTICLVPGSIPGQHAASHLVCTRELIWRAKETDEGDTASKSAV